MVGICTHSSLTRIFSAFIFVATILISQPVDGSGRISIRLVNYTNPVGLVKQPLGGGVACCDQPAGNVNSCLAGLSDPQFVVCITPTTRRLYCDFLNVTSKIFRNKDTLTFTSKPFDQRLLGRGPVGPNVYMTGSTAVSSRFKAWDGAIFIKIQVLEGDQLFPVTMTEMTLPYAVSTPAQFGSMEWKTLTLYEDGITMTIDISVQCDAGFRDMFCSCKDKNTTQEHTMCTRERQRVCLPGWAEPPNQPGPIKCLQSTLPCHPDNDPCYNNATCGTYNDGNNDVIVCACPQDYTGILCETHMTTTTTTTTTTTITPPATTMTTTTPKPTYRVSVPPTPNPATTVATTVWSSTTPQQWTQTSSGMSIVDTTTNSTTLLTVSTQPALPNSGNPATGTTTTMSPTSSAAPPSSTAPPTATSDDLTSTPMHQSTSPMFSTAVGPLFTKSGVQNGSIAPETQAPSADEGASGGDNSAAVAGGAVGGLAALSLVALLLLLRKRICRKNQPSVSDVERDSVKNFQEETPETGEADKLDKETPVETESLGNKEGAGDSGQTEQRPAAVEVETAAPAE